MNTKKKYALTAEQDRYIQRKVVQVLLYNRKSDLNTWEMVREADLAARDTTSRALTGGYYHDGWWVDSVYETKSQVVARRKRAIAAAHWYVVGEQDSYDFRVLRIKGRWFVRAGCRTLTLLEYYKHIDSVLLEHAPGEHFVRWAERRERMIDKCMQHCADAEYRIQAELLLSKQDNKK